MSAKKIRVGVLMGGASAERQISLVSGMGIASHLDPSRYEVVMLDRWGGTLALPRLPKATVADRILDRVVLLRAAVPAGHGR